MIYDKIPKDIRAKLLERSIKSAPSREWIYYNLPRRSGKTTAIAKMCKENGWTMLCVNGEMARLYSKRFGVKCASYKSKLAPKNGPYVWDHLASSAHISELIKRCNRAEAKNR